jgi:hypothetical protein
VNAAMKLVQGWNNIMLRVPPEQHILKFLVTAATNRTVADDFGAMFDQPLNAWRFSRLPSEQRHIWLDLI